MAAFEALRTRYWRWCERALSAPPLLGWQLLRQALRGQRPFISESIPAGTPLFVLSTGRCGTHTLSVLLGLAADVQAFHEPLPDLRSLANQVYHTPQPDLKLCDEALRLARSQLWQATNMAGRRYVETSHYLSFLAPVLLHLLPAARFLHLTRAPQPFVSSALRLGWFADSDKFSPCPGSSAATDWDSRDAFAKSVWYWAEINRFARDFVCALPPGQGLQLRSEDIFAAEPQSMCRLFALVDSEPPPQRRIRRVLGHSLNAGHHNYDLRSLHGFSAAQLKFLQQECAALARELGYESVTG